MTAAVQGRRGRSGSRLAKPRVRRRTRGAGSRPLETGTRKGGASRPRHGASVTPAGRRPPPGPELRSSGIRPAGPRTPGARRLQPNPERREAPGGSACQPPAAQAQCGHVALPAPGGRPLPGSLPPGRAAPRPPDSPASQPRGPCLDSPATSLTPAARRKWPVSPLSPEIPAVRIVTSLATGVERDAVVAPAGGAAAVPGF